METKPFRNLPQLPNGTSLADNIKLNDCLPFQHTDINEGVNSFNKITIGQMLCEPVATAGAISGDTYSATCYNYPDFAISYSDEQQNSHYYVGMKVRVVFNNGITYGSVSGGTYPKLNINDSGAIPLLAQGKTMASGACSAGQTLEFTLIPYGNGVAWDADSNVRESTSDYTIYTDGTITYTSNYVSSKYCKKYTSCTTFGSVSYPYVFKITLAQNSIVHIRAYTYTSENNLTGFLDGYVNKGQSEIIEQNNYTLSISSNIVTLSAYNAPNYTKIFEVDVLEGDVISMYYA